MATINLSNTQTNTLLRNKELRIDTVFNKNRYNDGSQKIIGVDDAGQQVELLAYVETHYIRSDDTLEVYIYLEE